MASAWSAASRTPSRPPWTTGCRVLTRPSIISGKPVRSATSFTGRPKPAMAARVPPVETSSTPRPCRVRAASSSPVLSDREIRARFGATRSGAGGKSGAAGMAASVSGVGSGRRGAFSTVCAGIEPPGLDQMTEALTGHQNDPTPGRVGPFNLHTGRRLCRLVEAFGGDQPFGKSTVSMTWITPLVQAMSAVTTFAPLTLTPSVPSTSSVSPLTEAGDRVLPAMSAA